jgi:ABC-type sugar transport system ATPase subunit
MSSLYWLGRSRAAPAPPLAGSRVDVCGTQGSDIVSEETRQHVALATGEGRGRDHAPGDGQVGPATGAEPSAGAVAAAGSGEAGDAPEGRSLGLPVVLRGVSKSFGGVAAVRSVDLDVPGGTIHAIVGENGAGKSTVGKVVAGVHSPDAGTLEIGGTEFSFGSPRDALGNGVTIVEQELSLVPHRSVLENVYLGMATSVLGVVNRQSTLKRYQRLTEEVGFSFPPDVRVGSLRIADQQKVEIMRAIARRSRVIVMDEPTASLTSAEADVLYDVLRDLRAKGVTVILISHFLDEVLRVCDNVTVMRDGAVVGTYPTAEQTKPALISLMIGRDIESVYPDRAGRTPGEVVLRTEGLRREPTVNGVDLTVRAGEIVVLSGLVGSGRTEVARLVFGADRRTGGEIFLDGEAVRYRHTRSAIRDGVAMVPESRKIEGLFLSRSAEYNLALAHRGVVSKFGVTRRRGVRALFEELSALTDLRPRSPKLAARAFSGGNQQKILYGRWLAQTPRLLILDEPTRGVDVGAKQKLYQLISDIADQGVAVLVISSEMEEVLGLADRVVVMRQGVVTAELVGEDIAEQRVMTAAFETTNGGTERSSTT